MYMLIIINVSYYLWMYRCTLGSIRFDILGAGILRYGKLVIHNALRTVLPFSPLD